jgi:hypothetical protein
MMELAVYSVLLRSVVPSAGESLAGPSRDVPERVHLRVGDFHSTL